MLNNSEIAALANKLNWGEKLTRRCVEDTLSNNRIVDGKIVKDKIICDFLRTCSKARFYPTNDGSIYDFFRNTFTSDIEETLVYFYNDTFFGPVISYLHLIEESPNRFKLMDATMENNFLAVLMLDLDMDKYQVQKSIDFPIEILIDNCARNTNQDVYSLTLGLVPKIITKIGFKVFQSEYVTENLLEYVDISYYKPLEKVATSLKSYYTNIKKQQHYYNYCLCERLWLGDYGRRQSFRIAAAIQDIPSTSAHRRYYDVLKELKEKGIRYEELISSQSMRHIDRIINTIKGCSSADEVIAKLRPGLTNLSKV